MNKKFIKSLQKYDRRKNKNKYDLKFLQGNFPEEAGKFVPV